MIITMAISIKRIYDNPSELDGYRILVDRLWPRGVSKEKAALDMWLKDVAPSSDLRTWFGHKKEKYAEFKVRYEAELDNNPALTQLKDELKKHKVVTLLYAAHDPAINHARVLLTYLSRD
jgi:DNA-3-methyladenine glycosylase